MIVARTNAQNDRRTRAPAAGEMKKSITIIYIHTLHSLLHDIPCQQHRCSNRRHPNNHDTDHVTTAHNVKSS